MGELTIHLEDAKLLETLEQMAASHGRPVAEEVEALVRRAAEEHRRRMSFARNADALVAEARRIRAMAPKNVPQTDSLEIIREMREERMRDLGY